MSKKRIVDVVELDMLVGTEKIPTGGRGVKTTNPQQIADYTRKYLEIVTKDELQDTLLAHTNLNNNPHNVTKSQVGLGNVDNTSDVDKPISNATRTALDNKVNVDGNAKTATTLLDGSKINGSTFNGGSDIVTSYWGASRSITIGNSTKSVNGSGSVNYSLSDIGALASTGGNVTGDLSVSGTLKANLTGNVNGSVNGNSTTADTLKTARTITLTGDVTYTTSFNGSANVTGVATLSNSGVTAGSYGSTTVNPVITVDAKGRVTSVTTATIPTASTNTAGLVQLNDTLTSSSTTLALTAKQGKALADKVLGVNQTTKTKTLVSGTVYTHTGTKPIHITVSTEGSSSTPALIKQNSTVFIDTSSSNKYCLSLMLNSGDTYQINGSSIICLEYS